MLIHSMQIVPYTYQSGMCAQVLHLHRVLGSKQMPITGKLTCRLTRKSRSTTYQRRTAVAEVGGYTITRLDVSMVYSFSPFPAFIPRGRTTHSSQPNVLTLNIFPKCSPSAEHARISSLRFARIGITFAIGKDRLCSLSCTVTVPSLMLLNSILRNGSPPRSMS